MPLTIYQPVFVLWIVLLRQLGSQLLFAIWTTCVFSSLFSDFYRQMIGRPTTLAELFSPYLTVFAVSFLLFTVVVGILRARNYRTTKYRLYFDRIEIEDGFLTIHAKRLMFRDVREVSLQRGILQRSAGLGSIYIATQATESNISWSTASLFGMGSTFGNGAMIRDIRDAGQVYERLRGVVDDACRN